jgi:hypothetical protein
MMKSINSVKMVNEDEAEAGSPLNKVMEDVQRELVRQVPADARDANRDIDDALETE